MISGRTDRSNKKTGMLKTFAMSAVIALAVAGLVTGCSGDKPIPLSPERMVYTPGGNAESTSDTKNSTDRPVMTYEPGGAAGSTSNTKNSTNRPVMTYEPGGTAGSTSDTKNSTEGQRRLQRDREDALERVEAYYDAVLKGEVIFVISLSDRMSQSERDAAFADFSRYRKMSYSEKDQIRVTDLVARDVSDSVDSVMAVDVTFRAGTSDTLYLMRGEGCLAALCHYKIFGFESYSKVGTRETPEINSETKPSKPGVFTLHFENIWTGLVSNNCGDDWECVAKWELDMVFESKSDVGGTITLVQNCYIWGDGKLFGNRFFGTGCLDAVQKEYRIEPHGEFRRRVSGSGIGPGTAMVWKYLGTDDGGNPIYLERALHARSAYSGLDLYERDQDWLDKRRYKGWRPP